MYPINRQRVIYKDDPEYREPPQKQPKPQPKPFTKSQRPYLFILTSAMGVLCFDLCGQGLRGMALALLTVNMTALVLSYKDKDYAFEFLRAMVFFCMMAIFAQSRM